jgi:uncharacterized OsmC-like protein
LDIIEKYCSISKMLKQSRVKTLKNIKKNQKPLVKNCHRHI